MTAESDSLARINEQLRTADADTVIRTVLESTGLDDGVALTTSFGIQSALMLHLVTRHKPDIPVIWIDTGYLPAETYQYAQQLTERLGLNLHVYQADVSAQRVPLPLNPCPPCPATARQHRRTDAWTSGPLQLRWSSVAGP